MRKCDDLISPCIFYQEKKGRDMQLFFLMTSVYYVSISRRNISIQVVQHALVKYLFFVNCYFKFLSVRWKLKYPYWSLCIKVVPSCVTFKMTWDTSKVITLVKKNLKKFDHDLESSLAIWFIHAPKHLEHPVCSSKYNKR